MSDDAVTDGSTLQFDRVVAETPATDASQVAVTCRACGTQLTSEYYQVNGVPLCAGCRQRVETHAESGRGVRPLAVAALFGLGGGIAGAAIYYAVLALANLEIGIVAILIGYMVGYSVRKGAGGRGGLRFQILAAVLTYTSVAFAYAPIVVQQAFSSETRAVATDTSATPTIETSPDTSTTVTEAAPRRAETEQPIRQVDPSPSAWRLARLLVVLFGFILSLPVLVIIDSMPGGAITALIIGLGIRQAWQMTRAPMIEILGPYRVGSGPRPAESA